MSFFERLKQGLTKTRTHFGLRLRSLFSGKTVLDDTLKETLETLLLTADFGLETTEYLLAQVQAKLSHGSLQQGQDVFSLLQEEMVHLLSVPMVSDAPAQHRPCVILMVGVNGAGKTTTIGKLAQYYQRKGNKIMLAAGDTFRAAAVEQLQLWGKKNEVPVIAQHTGADSASVVFDAFQSAKAKQVDMLFADTAGRLHTQFYLMEELKKIKRVLKKIEGEAPHETWLVLDASIGQNGLAQARQFHEAIGLTGIIMTKLDGTAKGGIVFAVAHALGLPVRFIGVGEGVDDLREFDPVQFVEAIIQDDRV